MNYLHNKIFTHPDGRELRFLSGKPVNNSNRMIYLTGTIEGEKHDYALWVMEEAEGGCWDMWPYKGEDNDSLMLELMEDFVAHAFDE